MTKRNPGGCGLSYLVRDDPAPMTFPPQWKQFRPRRSERDQGNGREIERGGLTKVPQNVFYSRRDETRFTVRYKTCRWNVFPGDVSRM